METYVVAAYRAEIPNDATEGNNLPGRDQLYDKLHERELRPVVSRLAEAAFTSDGVQVYETVNGEQVDVGIVPHDSVGVVLNRLDRSFKDEKLPEGYIPPPRINENASRSLVFRKNRTHDEVLHPLGLAMPTVLAGSGENVAAFLQTESASRFVVKPNNGTNSKNIHMLDRAEVVKHFDARPEDYGAYIVQTAHDFTRSFPSAVRAYDRASQESFDAWSRAEVAKELRVYGFHSPEQTTVFPVARAMKDGDQWFFVDPDSLPERVIEGTCQASAKAAAITEAAAFYGTVDYGYGSDGHNEPDFYAIEMNGRMPYLVGYDKHAGIADLLRDLLADQIKATADASAC